ncbi:hypothetical protein N6H14_01870 [Paenibacillus sp. CC-CFT747]|nr:hypothetical protein N6H14_01870 [Paenibacillus sp. CC-CFT747]
MAGWPGYWEGLPPMHYATHAVSPLLALANKEAELVYCLGSGRIAERLAAKYQSPFAVETALFRLRDSDLAVEVTRSLFETSREYIESFDVYADQASFEWQQLEGEQPIFFHGEEGSALSFPTLRTCSRKTSADSQPKGSMMRTLTSICPLNRAAAMAAPIRILPMSLS